MTQTSSRLIALHLPQFHPIPENDEWWGKGFTEWTNTVKARPMYKGHYQPHLPTDLGFYDLRLPEARQAQADLARDYGVEGFCYYHYWFAGRRILERPVEDIVRSGQPDFPFCLCWANESWTGIWHGAPHQMLLEQTYPGEADYRAHFAALLPAFLDRRYIRVDDKPLFLIYKPKQVPDLKGVLALWRQLAKDAGLPGLYVIGARTSDDWAPAEIGLDATQTLRFPPKRQWVSRSQSLRGWFKWKMETSRGLPTVHDYAKATAGIWPVNPFPGEDYPTLVPNWDNTPRSGANGLVLEGSTPELFAHHVRAIKAEMAKRKPAHKLVFLKSWNEWAEGNHFEPDRKFGLAYLEVLKREFATS